MLLLIGSVIYNDYWNNVLNYKDKGVVINFVDNRNGVVKMEYLKMVLVKVYVFYRIFQCQEKNSNMYLKIDFVIYLMFCILI